MCDAGRCTIDCSGDGECAALGVDLTRCSTSGVCISACTGERIELDASHICMGGLPVACSTLDATYCDVCQGMCPGQRCISGTGCGPLAIEGEACLSDDDCNTDNCSPSAGVCRVPLESACTTSNCDVCITDATGWSYCSRECLGTEGLCAGDRCLGRTDENFFYCRPACGTGCRGTCEIPTSGAQYCRDGGTWTLGFAHIPGGGECRFDSQCAPGECLAAASCDARSNSCSGGRGFCTAACTSDTDCGGGHCVAIPCVGTATTHCGNRCLPACSVASDCSSLAEADCRAVPSASTGANVTVCDPRNDLAGDCRSASDCVSGNCSSGLVCIAGGGAANGASCSAPADCASGICQTGHCHGSALRGGACTTDYDCQVGTCSTSHVCN